MNRIEATFKNLKEKKQKAFITYMTAGLPDLNRTAEIIKLQKKSGTDIVELGIPFSDPVADGPIIQASSMKSLQKGTNLIGAFEIVRQVRISCDIPIIFMLYYNTILHYGISSFIESCISIGVDGILIPDLPSEETFEINEYLTKAENPPLLIPLMSPVSGDRIPKILASAKGFVYCVSSLGVTGQNTDFHRNIKTYLETIKTQSNLPLIVGFGIRCAEDIISYMDVADGCIVGSHFIKLMEDHNYDNNVIQNFIQTFKSKLIR